MSPAKRVRASVVCQAEGRLLVVRLRDPVSGVEALFPPGGGIEEGETPAETARRETLEETGLVVRVDASVELVEIYPFRWAGVDYEVTTHYFAASPEAPFDPTLPTVVDAPYNLGALWLPVGEALEGMSIHRTIASAVARVVRLANHAGWRRHANHAGPASTLLMIHDPFRAASSRLVDLLARQTTPDVGLLARAFIPLAQTLHHHHHAEEAMLFPMVTRRTGVPPEQLVDDHAVLTRAIAAVEEALFGVASEERARAAIRDFDEILVTHLDREERLVIPVLLEMRADEAWALLHSH